MTISVAMCTYNGEEFLGAQLASITAQQPGPDELVVCDDGSSDGTVSQLQRFATEAPFPVRIHVNVRNLGYAKNFETAISLCTGDLIALCDQDDVWDPHKLSKSAQLLEDEPEIGLVCTDAEVVDRNLNSVGQRMSQTLGFGRAEQDLVARGEALAVLVRINFVTGTTMTFRSSFRPDLLPIPDGWVHDGWIALMLSLRTGVAFIGEPLTLYRQHGANQIGAPARRRWRSALLPETPAEDSAVRDAERWQVAFARAQPFAGEADLALLAGKKLHAQARAALPARRLPRLPGIVSELVTHRYHRYSAGAGSALKDLLAPR
jgi:hypothetical protein